MREILQAGEAQDLLEIGECGQIKSPTYRATQKLGSGKGGTTYKAHSGTLMIDRAIKVIDPDKVNLNEAKLMSRLNRQDLENIVQLYEAGDNILTFKDQPRYAIVMEYVEGLTIKELIDKAKQEGKTSILLDQALHYGAQLLNGIVSLRSHGITHRDLNPKNIKVTVDGIVKILDFGIATEEENPEPKDNRCYGGPSDLFSWGLILYEMITGEHFIVLREEEMGTETHAALVLRRKAEIRTENGHLKEEYARKIQENVPELVFPYIYGILNSTEIVDVDKELPLFQHLFAEMRIAVYKEQSMEEFRRQSAQYLRWSEMPNSVRSMFESSFWEKQGETLRDPERRERVLAKCQVLFSVEDYLTLTGLLKDEYNPLKGKP